MAPHVIPIDEKNILFETRHGVVHYNSTIAKDYQQPFNVLIRQVRTTKGADSLLFAGNFSANGADKITSKQPKDQIHTLPFQSNNIYFSFSAVYFEDAVKNEYSYLLENFDAEWSEWTPENRKEYTNLPAGKYTFKVKARNVYGAVSKETTYQFVITPPWYQTTWAYILFVVGGLLLLWAIIQLYTRRLKNQKEKLEILVHERTQKIEAQADTLKEINEEIIQQRDKIDQAYQNVQLLSEIGKDITATFSMADISNIVYERIQHLMDVEEFGIGYYLPKQDAISFNSYYYKGKTLPPLTVPMSNKNRLAVHCVAYKKEIIIGDLVNEYQAYVEKLEGYDDDELLSSMICLPLLAGGEVIGIASVQSSRKNAYSKHQINIFRNLAIYIAIALKNANSYAQIDHQNIKITDSIRYAQNIQATILPSDKMMHRCFEDHAIIYWPKDIVSGDFYWLLQVNHPQTNDLYTFVSVIDCTGHGVPGAFMSLIGYQLLNDIVQRHILEPYLMLEELDRLIVKALRQRETENKDGMDVCMCRLQKLTDGTTELLYSGAKRDLFYMEEGEWKMIKGDRVFIGGFSEGKDTKFNNNVTTLQPGTQIYMTSDGIADMPNDRRRSFGMRRLNGALQDNAHLPMAEQKRRLIEAIRAHQGNQEQRDDVTLLAVKI
jgi:serine phosphatase RsbU (regulator of sigma subunit)